MSDEKATVEATPKHDPHYRYTLYGAERDEASGPGAWLVQAVLVIPGAEGDNARIVDDGASAFQVRVPEGFDLHAAIIGRMVALETAINAGKAAGHKIPIGVEVRVHVDSLKSAPAPLNGVTS